MPNYKLVLDRGDGSDPETVEDYDSRVGMPPGFDFHREGEHWQVDRVTGNTLYCKPAA